MARRLLVFLYGAHVGEVVQSAQGRVTFTYSKDWLQWGSGVPLSPSMPLPRTAFGHDVVNSYLWGSWLCPRKLSSLASKAWHGPSLTRCPLPPPASFT